MAETPNHYAVLGLSQEATAAQIKAAYRRQVKTAHPDTGGSAEAMQRLTEAYEALSDPLARRSYDASRQQRPPRTEPPRSNPASSTSSSRPAAAADPSTAQPDSHAETHARAQAEVQATIDHRQNMANTRRYVWSYVEEFGLLALMTGAALSFVSLWLATPLAQAAAGIAGFAPLYWLVLQLIYLVVPEFKLSNYFTTRHPFKAEPRERLVLLLTATAWLPFGIIWATALRLLFNPR